MKRLLVALVSVLLLSMILLLPTLAEGGSDKESATPVVADGETNYGTIATAGRMDWYTLTTGDEDAFYHFTLNNESCPGRMSLYVCNSRDVQLLSMSVKYAGSSKSESLWLEPNTTYYLMVEMHEKTTGNYAFHITSQADDHGNSRETATEIKPNQRITCTVNGTGDEDWFVLHTGPVTQEYKMLYYNESSIPGGRVDVYSEQGKCIEDLGARDYSSDHGYVTLEGNLTYYFKAFFSNPGIASHSFILNQCWQGHTPATDWTTTTQPTCTVEGQQQRLCTVCGEGLETRSVPALGHEFAHSEVIREATATSLGTKKSTCDRCGEVEYTDDYSKVWIIPVIAVAIIAVLIGVINYARAFRRKY